MQSQVDGLVSHFVEEVASPTTLAAMVAGGMAYRVGRIGVMTFGVGAGCNVPLRVASIAVGLGSEVTAFEFTNRVLQTVGAQGRAPGQLYHQNIWSWSGSGGWQQGLLHSLITFGMLKGTGHLAREENLIFQHAFQSTAMVVGHNTAGLFGISSRPEGSLAEQFLHAEATNLKLGAGIGLAHAMAPGISAMERGLDVSLRTMGVGKGILPYFLGRILRADVLAPLQLEPQAFMVGPTSSRPQILMMEAPPESRKGRDPFGLSPLPPVLAKPSRKVTPQTFIEEINQALGSLPPTCRCLIVHVEAHPGKALPLGEGANGYLRDQLIRSFLENPLLMEIRFHFLDGSMKWFAKGDLGEVTVEHEEAESARRMARDHYRPEEIQKLQLYLPWSARKNGTSLPTLLRESREKAGLTKLEVAERVRQISGEKTVGKTIRRYETSSGEAIPFPVMKALSQIFELDIRDLITISNKTRFPDLSPQEWITEHYPIYLESEADRRRLDYYRENDPSHQSFGWLIYSTRKNPYRYVNTVQLQGPTGLSSNAFSRLEFNSHYPLLRTIQGLARTFGFTESDLIHLANHSHYPELPLADLFPDQAIYIDPNTPDLEKIRFYHENPGTIGQSLFAYRKSLKGYLTGPDLSRRFKRDRDFWDDRESGARVPQVSEMKDWFGIFQLAGLSFEPLVDYLEKQGVSSESPSLLFAQALGSEKHHSLVARTGINARTVGLILQEDLSSPARIIHPETILDLQRALPRLRGDLFFRAYYPYVVRFFPEAGGELPYLRLTGHEIEEASRLNIGERLFAYRMDHGIELGEMAKRLGIADTTLYHYENLAVDVADPKVIGTTAEVLEINPRLLYLHYHPQILKLFNIGLGPDETRFIFPEENYRAWVSEKGSLRDPSNLRRNLESVMLRNGLESDQDLMRHMKLSTLNLAQKYLQPSRPLTPEDIARLLQSLPELSYRRWYEHFNRSSLAYFLGRTEEGLFRYELPPGMNWKQLESYDVASLVKSAMAEKFSSRRAAAEAIGISYLAYEDNFQRSIRNRAWSNDTIARISRGLDLDRRLFFLFFRYDELKPILEGLVN